MARRNKRKRPVQKLIQLARSKGPKGLLNYPVLDHAEQVNAGGLRKQLQYLQNNIGSESTESLVNYAINTEAEIGNFIYQALHNDKFNLLIRTVYDLKVKEAHDIAHSRARKVLRYLIDKIGVEGVNQIINGGE